MVRKITFLFLIMYILTFVNGNNLYIIVEKNIQQSQELDTQLFKSLFSNVQPNTLRIVHIVDLSKESFTRKVNEFVQDPQGTYVYFRGSYYYTSSKARYRYDSQKKMYVQDPKGSYIYMTDYPWTRSEEDKYIISAFYKRYEKTISETYYHIALYVTDIDKEKMFIRSITPIVSTGNNLKEAIERASQTYKTNLNEYSQDKIDIVVLFDEKFDKIQRMYLLGILQLDTRYNIYDRTYLNELFKAIALDDLFGKGNAIKFNPPKFLILMSNYAEQNEENRSEKYYFFENPVSGKYIKKSLITIDQKLLGTIPVSVDVGNYYSYDSKSKTYLLNRKEGQYVKYLKGPWEENEYVADTMFFDYILTTIETVSLFNSFLLSVLDAERGIIVNSATFEKISEIVKKEPIDRFGSEKVNSLYLTKIDNYKNLANSVQHFLKAVFPLTTVIDKINDKETTLLSGKNIGIKVGTVFQSIKDGYTGGYVKVTNVSDKSSKAEIFYILPGEKIYSETIAIETQKYPTNFGLTTGMYLSFESTHYFGFEVGYTNFDINGNYQFGILFGASFDVQDLSTYYVKLSKSITQNFEILTKVGTKISEPFVSLGCSLSSYQRNSLFAFGGVFYYAQFDLTVYPSILPSINIGLEFRY